MFFVKQQDLILLVVFFSYIPRLWCDTDRIKQIVSSSWRCLLYLYACGGVVWDTYTKCDHPARGSRKNQTRIHKACNITAVRR